MPATPYEPVYQTEDEEQPDYDDIVPGGTLQNIPIQPVRGRLDPRWFRLVDEKDTGRKGRGWDTNAGHRNYIRIFLVVTWDVEMSIQAVCAAPGLPRPYSAYQSRNGLEYDVAAYAVAADAEQFDDDRTHWLVTVTYSTDVSPRDVNTNPGWADQMQGEMNEPWLTKPEFEWGSEEMSVALPRDLDGKPFLNSAKQPFTPAPMFPQAYPVLTIKRYEPVWTLEDQFTWSYRTNADTFLGAKPAFALSLPPTVRKMFRGKIPYCEVTHKVKFYPPPLNSTDEDPLNWGVHILDAGLNRLAVVPEINAGQPVPIFRGPEKVSQPVLLDGAGQPSEPDGNGNITAHYIKFRVYKEIEFANLLSGGSP